MPNKSIKISAVIITLNEEKNIARCIHSLQEIADEIVVVDSFSTDRTKEICDSLPVRWIEHAFEGHIEQKNFAVQQATYDHVLSLDADEVLSDALKQSVAAVKKNWVADGYTFNRLTNYCGRWIRHSGWYPDKKLRLWNRHKGHWAGINPHDSVKLQKNTQIEHLQGDLLHYSYDSIAQHVDQTNKFSSIGAQQYFARKKAYFLWHLIIYPPFLFLKRYILQLGFLDGLEGFIICKNAAYYKFIKYAKLRELYRNKPVTPAAQDSSLPL